ncbi:hypothetical protein [Cryobacterium zhongshanensis]|uniref:Uncharacterized protein n=1 Tax=Cryobacterium zhongshanensis TaxID=2928153 RepID=A0AA41UFX3_9MICO|nr:hypothetical protein [Cryobacterium zhongshanensis]MCI4656649.1 hypothetical protein [Cryobacterium zhongshanensis]
MYFTDREPMDVPPPPTVDTAAKMFGTPVIGFLPQASLSELGVGTVGTSTNGSPSILESVAISYTLWRNPQDHDDPANFADVDGQERDSLEREPSKPLPDWMLEFRKLMRYPSLWEGVMTTRVIDTEGQTPESVLVAHTNHILMNTFREQRVLGEFPGNLDSPVTERHIQRVRVPLDGVRVPGLRIDSDPHVYSIGADLGDRILTAVVARDHLPYVTLAFQTRA